MLLVNFSHELAKLDQFIECFKTTFLHTHFRLNWVDEDDWGGWGWFERKARRHWIHEKDYIQIKPEAPGVWPKDSIATLPLLGLRTQESAGVSHLKAPSGGGGGNNPARWRLQPGLWVWFPPDLRRRCSKLLNLNWWKGYRYHKILIMVPRVGDGDPSFPVHPLSMKETLHLPPSIKSHIHQQLIHKASHSVLHNFIEWCIQIHIVLRNLNYAAMNQANFVWNKVSIYGEFIGKGVQVKCVPIAYTRNIWWRTSNYQR